MQLIKIEPRQIAGETIQTCNARDLWEFVESKQQFSDWIKSRIEKYGFIEGEDFTVDKFINGRATIIDYHLTIEAAKELAMVENNEKGREVRRYFIECERRAKAPPQINLDDPAALRPLLLSYTEKVIELQEVVAEQAPKVAALERMSAAEGSLVPREAAKCVGTTQTKLYDWLLEHKWCYRAASNNDRPGPLRAYATRVANGDLEERNVSAGFTRDGVEQVKPQVYITIKGQTKIAKLLSGEVEQVFDIHIPLPEPVTLKELHLAALEAAMAVGPDRVRSVIAGFGAPKIAEVDPSKRDVLLAALKRAVSEPF